MPAIRTCTPADIAAIATLEASTLAALPDRTLLRANGKETLLRCLSSPHTTIGAFIGTTLIAFAILYCPESEPNEDLAHHLSQGLHSCHSANYKLCIVHPDYRGQHLQVTLGQHLEQQAQRQGIELLCATVSPANTASRRSLALLGYTPGPEVIKYTFPRIIYHKKIEP